MNDNAFNLAIGVLALTSAAASIVAYLHSYRPSEQMETFDSILNRSKILFAIAKEDGLIAGPLQIIINAKVKRLEISSLGVRARAYGPSQGSRLRVIDRRLLKDIGLLTEEAKALRLFIVTSAQQQQQLQSHWREGASSMLAEPSDQQRPVASEWRQLWVCGVRYWRTKEPSRTDPRFPA